MNAPATTDTVSYTHLDVYKRQDLNINIRTTADTSGADQTTEAINKTREAAQEAGGKMCIRDRYLPFPLPLTGAPSKVMEKGDTVVSMPQ